LRFSPAQIRRYYDRNTPAFVVLGQGGGVGAIHRAVWGPGVTGREDAFHFVEDRISEHIALIGASSTAGHIVDLGCGVGASLCYLAGKLPISGTGITLSPVQASLAAKRIQLAGLAGRIDCVEGDYNDLPAGMRRADLAYAIESFVHGPSPERFFAQCRGLLRPGGLLVICDDFKRATADPAAGPAIERFCRGWHVNTLLDPRELQMLAQDAGFVHVSTIELSRYLELGRPRDRAIAAFASLAGLIPGLATRFAPLFGGSALQDCLARGWIGYDLVVFQRALSETQPAVDITVLVEEERNRWP
jgi:SAM-dependent methyltransferase